MLEETDDHGSLESLEQKLEKSNSQDSIAALLRQASARRSLWQVRKIHSHLLGRNRLGSFNTYLGNLLIETYAKCGCLLDARKAFDSIPCKNIFTWTLLITAYAHSRQSHAAMHTLREMDCEGEKPNEVTFLGLVGACASSGDVTHGRKLHARIVLCGYHSRINLGNALVSMYGRCGCTDEARRVFQDLPVKNLVTFNSMLKAYVLGGCNAQAMELFDELWREKRLELNAITFTTVVGACSDLGCLERGIQIHEKVAGTRFEEDVGLATALVNMYGKCGDLDRAKKVFELMQERTVVTWSALVAAYAQNRHGREALQLHRRMMAEGIKPNQVTFLSVVSACATMAGLAEGREVHGRIVSAGLRSLVLDNALLVMYLKCKSLHEAELLFGSMSCRDVKSWLFMIAGYAQQGSPEKSLRAFKDMNRVGGIEPDEVVYANVLSACSSLKFLEDGKEIHKRIQNSPSGLESNTVVGTALVDFYSNCGELESAKVAFDRISWKDTAAWNAMIGACMENQQHKAAVQVFYHMNLAGDSQPSHLTFLAVLEACTAGATYVEGGRLYDVLVDGCLELGLMLETGIINMFAKSGQLGRARDVFERMPSRDLVAWTAMVVGYTHNGVVKEARELYQEMALQGLKGDEITYISILSSCAHSGLVDEGCTYFQSMTEEFGIEPLEEHYLCVIDMLGRAGRVGEAEEVVRRTSKQLGLVGWTSLLGACKTHGDFERANRIIEQVVKENPETSAPYVLLAQVCHSRS